MLIRTTRDLLIGAHVHPAGDIIKVDDQVGARLVKAGAAAVMVDVPPVADPADPETATLKPPRNAARRV